MKPLRKSGKVIAAFLLINFLGQLVFPTVSYALTAGPTAPEFSSFEPVDTTDMVNLLSGDLAYNMPVIEVPGPAGGYPLSLSYHAGIQPNEEASFVGLGFSLNPGAITRSVNGYPDDHKEITDVDHAYWAGGQRKTYDVGVSIGVPQSPANVNFGLSFSQDTYLGFGMGGYAGVGLASGLSNLIEAGPSVRFGINPYGGTYSSSGIGIGIGNAEKSAWALGASLQYTSNGFHGGIGIQSGQQTLLGASIGSNGLKGSLSVGGGSAGVNNAKAGKISTTSSSIGLDIPVLPGVNLALGYNYQRYWSDETAFIKTNGVLYDPKAKVENFDGNSFDSYVLPQGIVLPDSPDPDIQMGGSLPNFDNYIVTGQGMSGAIRPYMYKGLIFRQNKKSPGTGYTVKQYSYDAEDYRTEETEFRFLNDFSNRYQYEKGEFVLTTVSPFKAVFDDSQLTGETGKDGIANNHLAGSKHIEWFTNTQIVQNDPVKNPRGKGFIGTVTNLDRSTLPATQIGGFMATNESGVSYHYALPVYSKNEFVYSENIDQSKGKSFNSLSRPTKYAYQWLLTAVTGPDYVDQNGNNQVDNGDYGYWVSFDYTKFSSDYKWRNPSEGYHSDLDNNFKNYSSGSKEIYYIQTIRTASHVAVFNKSARFDSKEVTDINNGGFEPTPVYVTSPEQIECTTNCEQNYCTNGECVPAFTDCVNSCASNFPPVVSSYIYPESGLKLDDITLYNSSDFDSPSLTDSKILKRIKFQYDYSLSPQTANSYVDTNPSQKLGKLTLLSVDFAGKGGVSVLPPTTFSYDIDVPLASSSELYSVVFGMSFMKASTFGSAFETISKGDIFMFDQSGTKKYCVVVGKNTDAVLISRIGENSFSQGQVTNVRLTKNPPYQKNKYDIWNMYKSNLSDGVTEQDENLGRRVDEISARSVDVWSLRKIKSPLGSVTEIEYESDDYSNIALNPAYQFRLEDAYTKPNDPSVYLKLANDAPLEKMFKKNDPVNLIMVHNDNGTCRQFLPKIYEGTSTVLDIDLVENAVKISGANNLITLLTTNTCDDARNNFLAGHVGSPAATFTYGGGIRVKSVSLKSDESVRTTFYSYQTSEGNSSGVTSFEPYKFGSSIKDRVSSQWQNNYDGWKEGDRYNDTDYTRKMYDNFSKLLSIARELPSPGVMYKRVTVTESVQSSGQQPVVLPNYSAYDFEVFNPELVKVEELKPLELVSVLKRPYDGINFRWGLKRDIVIKDFTSRIGNVNRVTLYSDKGTKISETSYKYLHDMQDFPANLSAYGYQGLIQETYLDCKYSQQLSIDALVTRRHTYPSVLVSQSSTNYKTNITTTSTNQKFDFYSGQANKTLTLNSYGIQTVEENIAAYKQYQAMGLAINGGKNMLTQNGTSYRYQVDNSGIPNGLLSASVQTWSDQVPVVGLNSPQNGVWRKQSTYGWNGQQALQNDGAYPITEWLDNTKKLYVPFDWNTLANNAKWEKTSEMKLYDTYSHGLEVTDINNNYAATRMDPKQERVIASTFNGSYAETAYSGIEYSVGNTIDEGGVNRGEGNPTVARSHSGRYSLLTGYNTSGFNYTLKAPKADLRKKYRASVWVYVPGEAETQPELNNVQLTYTVNGVSYEAHPQLQKNKSKSWYLITLDVDPRGNEVKIICKNGSQRAAYFDDFRVHPLDASMTSYVYDPFSGELNYLLGPNNLYTRFEYDAMGRLVRTTKELMNFDFGDGKESFRADKTISATEYNYGKNN